MDSFVTSFKLRKFDKVRIPFKSRKKSQHESSFQPEVVRLRFYFLLQEFIPIYSSSSPPRRIIRFIAISFSVASPAEDVAVVLQYFHYRIGNTRLLLLFFAKLFRSQRQYSFYDPSNCFYDLIIWFVWFISSLSHYHLKAEDLAKSMQNF